MFGVKEFGLMKESAYFVITARGGIVDEGALADALKSGGIAAAGVDVFAVEPPPLDDPLVGLGNVILTPHTAGVTVDARKNCARGAAEQWIAFAEGHRPERIVIQTRGQNSASDIRNMSASQCGNPTSKHQSANRVVYSRPVRGDCVLHSNGWDAARFSLHLNSALSPLRTCGQQSPIRNISDIIVFVPS